MSRSLLYSQRYDIRGEECWDDRVWQSGKACLLAAKSIGKSRAEHLQMLHSLELCSHDGGPSPTNSRTEKPRVVGASREACRQGDTLEPLRVQLACHRSGRGKQRSRAVVKGYFN